MVTLIAVIIVVVMVMMSVRAVHVSMRNFLIACRAHFRHIQLEA